MCPDDYSIARQVKKQLISMGFTRSDATARGLGSHYCDYSDEQNMKFGAPAGPDAFCGAAKCDRRHIL
jgi:hypothetical protein